MVVALRSAFRRVLFAAPLLAALPAGWAAGYAVLHQFDRLGTGCSPDSGLTRGADGAFYGTTELGGTQDGGVVFRIDETGAFSKLHEFGKKSEGIRPYGGLALASDGFFYGTTAYGGAFDHGVIYRIDPAGTFKVIHTFDTAAGDGTGQVATLVQGPDGNLYGTTIFGGDQDAGTLYRVKPSGVFKTLHSFGTAGDGAQPQAGLIVADDGHLYGTTSAGGASGAGTLYRSALNGKVSVIHSFTGTGHHDGRHDGCNPRTEPIQASDGQLWGTSGCGRHKLGLVFSSNLKGKLRPIHNFRSIDGIQGPYSTLLQASDGNFYATNQEGGAHGRGTLFSITPDGVVSVLHDFKGGDDGADPKSVLVQGNDGHLYGTTPSGGPVACGTVFRQRLN